MGAALLPPAKAGSGGEAGRCGGACSVPAHLLRPRTCRFFLDRPPSLARLSPCCSGGSHPALGFRDPCVTRPGQGEPVLGFCWIGKRGLSSWQDGGMSHGAARAPWPPQGRLPAEEANKEENRKCDGGRESQTLNLESTWTQLFLRFWSREQYIHFFPEAIGTSN